MEPDVSPERYADDMHAAQHIRAYEIKEPSFAWELFFIAGCLGMAALVLHYADAIDALLMAWGL